MSYPEDANVHSYPHTSLGTIIHIAYTAILAEQARAAKLKKPMPAWAVHSWPYVEALRQCDQINGKGYGAEDPESLVLYFLSNAGHWRGDAAKQVKADLKAILNLYKQTK